MTHETDNCAARQALSIIVAQRPQVVVMCGISGSGKTVFARRLECAGYHRLSVDECAWRIHGSTLSDMPPEELKEVYVKALSELMLSLGEALERGLEVVIDAPMCKRAGREAVYSICRAAGVRPLTVYMSAQPDILAARLAGRCGSTADDQCITPAMLARFLEGFEAPRADEQFITIEQ